MNTAELKLQMRQGAAADWTSADPILLEGEIGYETDTGFWKWGDGATAWTSLSYDAFFGGSLTLTGTFEAAKVIAGDPGTEGTGITVNGATYESVLKASDIGGANAAQMILHRHSTTLPSVIIGSRSLSDTTAHAIVADNDILLTLLAAGHDGTDYALSSEIRFEVDGTPGNDDMPGQITFLTTPIGADTSIARMRIRATGNIEMDFDLDVAGLLQTSASTSGGSGFNIEEGVAPTLPNDGDHWLTAAGEYFVQLDGISTDLSAIGGGAITGKYRFSTSTAPSPPSGQVRFDTGAYSTVTELFISDTTSDGQDATNFLTALGAGDQVYIQVGTDASVFSVWTITGSVTDEGNWFRIPVDEGANGVFPGNNNKLTVSLIFVAPDAGGDVTAGTQADNQIAVWNATAKQIEGDSAFTWDGTIFHMDDGKLFNINSQVGDVVTLVAGTGSVIIGNTAGQQIAFDRDHIQQKSNGTTAGTLQLQNLGGALLIGNAIPLNNFDVNADSINLVGPTNTVASTASSAGLNIAEGVAPTSPNDGDFWITAAGAANMRLNGVTIDLAATGGGGSPWTYTLQAGTSYTAVVGDFVVASNTGTVTITLPSGHNVNDTIIVKKTGSGGTVTVDGNASETIDGALTFVLNTQYDSIILISDGTNWLIV
jgi:hypothetical protein